MTVLPDRSSMPNVRSYAEARAAFDLVAPGRWNPVLGIVEAWAAEDPDAIALVSIDGAGELTAEQSTADVARESRRAARALLAAGVVKGDRVFVMLPRVPAWYSAVLGAIRIGAVPMPGPNLLTGKDIAFRISAAGATVAVTDAAGAVKVDEQAEGLVQRFCWSPGTPAPQGWATWDDALDRAGDGPTPQDPTAADDPMFVYFTSGTVSNPKMVLHSQASYSFGHVITARYWQDLRAGDRHWTVTDTGWAKATWGGLFGQWFQRATVVQVALGKPDADMILRTLARHRVTSFCAPPTLYRLLVQADLSGYELPDLRHCSSAGEPLNPEVIRAWREGTGLTVYDGYGQTETTNVVANYRGVEVRPGSMGLPTPGWDVDVVDDDGGAVEVGVVGNIAIRTEPRPIGLFGGYYRDDAATARVMRGGWYFTGDKAARDHDGYFWFEGRSDDVITSSAYRIGPFEVESALLEHPAVAEAAVVGKSDADRTEIVTAFVILAGGVVPTPELATELQDHVKAVTAPYKYPRLVKFVEELPKTVSGKIRRSELKARLNAGEWD